MLREEFMELTGFVEEAWMIKHYDIVERLYMESNFTDKKEFCNWIYETYRNVVATKLDYEMKKIDFKLKERYIAGEEEAAREVSNIMDNTNDIAHEEMFKMLYKIWGVEEEHKKHIDKSIFINTHIDKSTFINTLPEKVQESIEREARTALYELDIDMSEHYNLVSEAMAGRLQDIEQLIDIEVYCKW